MSSPERISDGAKVIIVEDTQTVLTDGTNVRHELVPKGTICDVVASKIDNIAGGYTYKLRLYGEIFFTSELRVKKVRL